jgi:hypothetical protein
MGEAPSVVTKDKFAQSRSSEDSKAAYDLGKTIAQYCLLINGGAVTAVIALLAKDKPDHLLLIFVLCGLVGYAIGVVVSVLMLYCVMMIADNWGDHWYYRSYEFDEQRSDAAKVSADKWKRLAKKAFWLAIIFFVISSLIVAYGMFRVTPTSVLSPAA